MNIRLTDEQSAWLGARVADGEFASVEDAILQVLDHAMMASIDVDDLDWAKPLVEEAERSITERGVITREEHRLHTAALLARLGAR